MTQGTYGSLGWNSHWSEILVFGLPIHRGDFLFILMLHFQSTIALHFQFSDPTACQFQKHLLIKQLLVLRDIMFNCLVGIVDCANVLGQITMFEVGGASE